MSNLGNCLICPHNEDRLHLLMDWKWAVQLCCLCLLEAVEAGWVVLAEAFEEEGWVEWEPGSVGRCKDRMSEGTSLS